ncbi:MAG: sulfatase-like hydrolase/transferase [Anaerolineae bacterium]
MAESPNLLVFLTDEQRYDTLACYGNGEIRMPNLNALAAQSCVVEEAYCTQPVCTPARGSYLTGLYPHAHGAWFNNIPLSSDAKCLPEYLPQGEANGYATAYFGKWHLGDEIFAQHGFQEWRSVESTWVNYNKHFSEGRDKSAKSTYHHYLRRRGYKPDADQGTSFSRDLTTKLPERDGKPAYLAREASRFIREHQDEPFALYVSFLEPHMPFYGPRDDQYDPDEVPLPANFDAVPGENDPLRARLGYLRFFHEGFERYDLSGEAGWRQLVASYWGLCSLIDTHIGRVMATLDECGLMDDTIVAFTSDHGDMMGSHRLLGKGVMYQESVRVPLLVRLPGQTTQRRITGPFSQIDLAPTLLDLMEQPVPDTHGVSRRELVEAGGALDEDAFIQWNCHPPAPDRVYPSYVLEAAGSAARAADAYADEVRTLITPDGWRFTYSPAGDHALFNLRDDPGERVNLAHRPDYRSLMGELTARMRDRQASVGDPKMVPETPSW